MREAGDDFRILKPVVRTDEERKAYKLNKGFIDEFLVYPFSQHDDALDCLSRIYDIDLPPPVVIDERSLEPAAFIDGS